MNTISLPGIRKIGYIACVKLSPNVALKSLAGIPIAVLTDITDVVFFGEPICDVVTDDDNNGRSEKTSLKFTTNQAIPTDKPLAWVVKCVNGSTWLIGSQERPYPIVKIITNTGTVSSNASISSVEITHTAIKSLLPVAV